jgi:hypothetical protein
MKKALNFFACIGVMLFITACANMPTRPDKVAGIYVSPSEYKELNCDELKNELDFLKKREDQLSIAQGNRVETSQSQAFWWGFGQGDGMEAQELATIRGKKEAVAEMISIKGCDIQEQIKNL